MSKRSRSNSPVPEPEDAEHQLSMTKTSTHAPKYFRASTSPPPSSSASETTDLRPMQCILPPHGPLTVPSAAAFDIHYAQEHTNRCMECNANFPTAWILDLHLNESHNPLIAAKREQEEKTVRALTSICHTLYLLTCTV